MKNVFVCVCTIFGGDIADNVDFVHGNLPVGFLFAETQSPAFLSITGGTLNTQEHRALDTRHTQLEQQTHTQNLKPLFVFRVETLSNYVTIVGLGSESCMIMFK